MMASLKINFENLRKGALKEVFEALEKAFPAFGIDFYIIGAFARDIWLDGNPYLPPMRATMDLDIAIYIGKMAQYQDLKNYLQTTFGFVPDKEPYRLYSPGGCILDIIPFGEIEKDHNVFLEGNPPVELSVFGTMVVTQKAVQLSETFKVITLPGLVIMKLISWSNRPDWREKDLNDFWFILQHYSDINPMLIFEEPFRDLLTQEHLDLKIAYAQILSRQMKDILAGQPEVEQSIFKTLSLLKGGFSEKEIKDMYAYQPNDEQILRWRLVIEMVGVLDE